MRRHFVILTIAFLTLTVGCTSQKQKIEKNAIKYLESTSRYDLDEASRYTTKQTREHAIPLMKNILKHSDTVYIHANQPASIKLTNTRVGDSTACVHYHKETPIQAFDDSINLILEDGAWLVDLKIALPPIISIDTAGIGQRIKSNLKRHNRPVIKHE